jgi:hypothetical protein
MKCSRIHRITEFPIVAWKFAFELPSHQIFPSVSILPHSRFHCCFVLRLALCYGVSPVTLNAELCIPYIPERMYPTKNSRLPLLHAPHTEMLNGGGVDNYKSYLSAKQR